MAGPATVVIKKYGNRRLYDTSTSRYINLEEIAALVREGKDLQVVDASSGEDLTRVTLTQIIVEDAKDQPGALPLELLRQIIIASDHAGREVISWYLRSAFDSYHKMQNALQSGLSEVQSLSPLQMVRNFIQGKPPEQPVNQPEPTRERDELQELKARIAELESRLANTKPGRPSRASVKSRKKKQPAAEKSGASRKPRA